MLSRVADSIYWMSRYIERADNVARYIDVNLHLSLDLPIGMGGQWEPLVTVTGDEEMFRERYGEATPESIVRFLTFDADYPNSILSCLRSARENARCVREVISSELWQQVNKFYLMVCDAAASGARPDELVDFFAAVHSANHLWLGIRNNTLAHGEGWHFSRMGTFVERADKTSRILDVKYFVLLPQPEYVGTPFDSLQWAALLKSCSALEMYRKRFQQITPSNVADFLVLDLDFPRAIYHCVDRAEQSLRAVTGSPHAAHSTTAERAIGRLRSEFAYGNIKEIISAGLHEYLDEFQSKLNAVDDAIFQTFFALRPAPEPRATQRQVQ